jgi:transcriptional regulator with XRE-family HTH domain
MMTPQEFRDWRVTMGFTQHEAAEELGVSKSTIELYESGRRRDTKEPVVIPKMVELACAALRRVSRDDPSLEHAVQKWHEAGERRYESLIDTQVADRGDAAFLTKNHFHLSYGIETTDKQELDPATLTDVLRRTNDEVHDLVRTGWSMFYIFTRDVIRPYTMVDATSGKGDKDFLECSLQNESITGATDLWRVSADGYATLLRGYFEDRNDLAKSLNSSPGAFISPNWLVRDLSELVRHARAFASQFSDAKLVSFRCEWRGLTNRRIADPMAMWGPYQFDKGAEARVSSGSWTVAQLGEKWPLIVATLAGPVMRAAGIGQIVNADWVKGQAGRWRSM